jgi:hypothetical protein
MSLSHVVTWDENGKLARTANFLAPSPVWENLSLLFPAGEKVNEVALDWHSAYVTSEFDSGGMGAYIVTTIGTSLKIYYVADIRAASPTATLLHTYTMGDSSVQRSARIAVSRTVVGFVAVHWCERTRCMVGRSTDGGATWSGTIQIGTTFSTNPANDDAETAFAIEDEKQLCTGHDGTNYKVYYASTKTENFAALVGSPAHVTPFSSIVPDLQGSVYVSLPPGYGPGTKSGLLALKVYRGSTPFGFVARTGDAASEDWIPLMGGLPPHPDHESYELPIEIVACYLDPYDFGAAYLVDVSGNCYYNPDWRSGASWEVIKSAADLQTAFATANGVIFTSVRTATVSMAGEGYLLLAVQADNGFGALIRIRRLQNGVDVSPIMHVQYGEYTNNGTENECAYTGTNRVSTTIATATTRTGRQNVAIWIVDWTATGTDWSNFDTGTLVISGTSRTVWWPKYETDLGHPGTDLKPQAAYMLAFAPWKKLNGEQNTNDQQILWSGPNRQIWKSEDGGTTWAAWTAVEEVAEASGVGSRPDTWELNIDNSVWVHYLKYLSLFVSDDAGETFTEVTHEFTGYEKGFPGWCGGFPSAQGQFYLGGTRFWSQEAPEAPNPLLFFTQDGGQTWHDWTRNLWALIRINPPRDQYFDVAGVVRFTPHPMEQ